MSRSRYFDNALPFSAKVGGLVPGGGLISLECNGGETAVGTQGIAGVVLQGDLEVDTLVCQGASPFGPVFEVTACDGCVSWCPQPRADHDRSIR